MSALLDVVLPVFIVIGAGYAASWRRLFSDAGVDGLMTFAQTFAIPCLLFQAIAGLDLGAEFAWPLLLSFYAGALSGFSVGIAVARLFGRPWADAVAIGFCGLFSNSVLLGLPIAERAYDADVLRYTYAIVAVHAPFCYLVGVTVMEMVRATDGGLARLPRKVAAAMFHNALVIGIALGFAANLSGVSLPGVLEKAIELVARSALPAALFGLGGVLYRYRPEGDVKVIGLICLTSLVLHPTVAWAIAAALSLPLDQLRASVLTAAMAPGVNTYIFANIYGAARRSAASGVLIGTGASILSVAAWLSVLP